MAPLLARVRWWFRSQRPAALGLTVIVAVVGGVVLTLVAGAVRTVTVSDRYVAALPFDYDVEIEQGFGPPRVEELARLPAIERVDAATFVFGGLAPVELSGSAFIFAGSLPPLGIGVLVGRAPAAPGEFVATESFLDAAGASLGDEFTLLTITQEQSDEAGFDALLADPAGPTLTATLVGVLDSGATDLQDSTPLALFPPSLLEIGDIGIAATIAVAALAPGSTAEDLRGQLDGLEGGDDFSISPATPIEEDVRTAVAAQAQGIVVLAAIVAGAAIAVLGQVLSRQFRLSEAERTILRSIGLSRPQLGLEPLCRAGAVVLTGSVAAAALAFFASGLFPLDFARRVEPHPGLRFDLVVHGGGPVLLAAVLLVGMRLLLLGGSREQERPPSPLIERLVSSLPNAQVATAVRFAFGSGSRPRSTGSSLVGLALVLGLVLGALTFGANLARLIDEPERYSTAYDLGIGAGGDTVPDEIVELLVEDPDIEAVTLYGASTVAVGSRSLGIVAMQPVRGELVPETIEGRLPERDDEIALGRRGANDLDVGVGDELEFSGASGAQVFRVTGIAIVSGIEESDVIGRAGLVTAAGLQRIDPSDGMSSAVIDLVPGAPADVAERLSEATGTSIGGRFDTPSEVVNLQRVRSVPFLVAGIVGVLAMLTVGHLLVTAVRRRQRDFAVLRALGVTSGWVGGVVHWQATLITALAAAVAVPVGVAAGGVVYRPYAEGLGARDEVAVPLLWIGATLLALAVVANVVAALPARRIRRETPTSGLSRA